MKVIVLCAIALLGAVALLATCVPSEKQKAEWAEKKRLECLDKICEGDHQPPHDYSKDIALKVNGQWYIGPRTYFSGGSGAVFYWPSKTPEIGLPDRKDHPEKGKPFFDVAIEVFLRTDHTPSQYPGYKFIELAQTNDWILSRTQPRPGLAVITMKHVVGPTDYYIDSGTYYVATDLRGPDGLPPVARCNHRHPSYGGGSHFQWQPGVGAGIRMNQKHCADWPEIYQEITRVLQLLKKA